MYDYLMDASSIIEADKFYYPFNQIKPFWDHLKDLEIMGKYPYLIAAAKKYQAAIISSEVSKSSKQGANQKIPDICKIMGIDCYHSRDMVRKLDFKL